MTNKKDLTNEELEKVSGGADPKNNSDFNMIPHGRQIDQRAIYEYINKTVYVKNNTGVIHWIKATILNVTEKTSGCNSGIVIKVKITAKSIAYDKDPNIIVGNEIEVSLNSNSVYEA